VITNRSKDKIRRAVGTDMLTLYHPQEKDGTYNHHPQLCKFKGRVYAMWSNGKVDEDDPGQRVLYTSSKDGKNWEEPRVLMEPSPAEGVLMPAGFYVYGDVLRAYIGFFTYWDYLNTWAHENTTLLCVTTKDGATWEPPVDLGIRMSANQGPKAIRSGRLIMSGAIMFPYTDDPDGIHGWKLAGTDIWPRDPRYDDTQGCLTCAQKAGAPEVCEGSFYQTDDGVLHMLQRSYDKVLYVTESRDDGETWSPSVRTEFTDCGSKFHCGRLPDGRYYIVSNPDPGTPRCPLVLSTSRDGEDFDREYVIDDRFVALRYNGRCKRGIYGYPHSLVDGDRLYVICSVNKEDVHVYIIDLADIADDRERSPERG
jgi:hypothetical protein